MCVIRGCVVTFSATYLDVVLHHFCDSQRDIHGLTLYSILHAYIRGRQGRY